MKNKEITIIELLNRIDTGKPIPEKIKMFEKVYKWDTDYKCYVNIENGADIGLNFDESELHITLEILDEENGEFEDIEDKGVIDLCIDSWSETQLNELIDNLSSLEIKIRKLIRNQKKIIEMLKKDEI